MQNWNQQWQVSAGTTSGTMPQPPTAPGYPPTGTDPMATMQANMQYFNQPAPSGYTAEQWAAAQQQNWAQWQQYQQQYQQWQAQYGAKYQETIKQMSASGLSGFPLVPPVMPPPLPKEDFTAKPPLPPDNMNSYQSSNMIPPHQNNLPLFSKTSGNPPLPLGQPPPPPDNPPPSNDNNFAGTKRSASNSITSASAKKSKNEDDELSKAEKKFDTDFKRWEEQFNNWKLQNANHPDKVLYKQYEAQWTSMREKLIERREQIRKKREAQRAKAESEKRKSMPGGEKLLNILTNTENQGLINNLLGIGKTLGLSGKENTLSSLSQTSSATGLSTLSTSMNVQSTAQSAITGVPATMTSDMTQQAWAAQQWAAQYNMASIAAASTYPAYQTPTITPSTMPNQSMVGPNLPSFNQIPPLGMQNTNNFSQPPPGFSQTSQSTNSQAPLDSSNMSRDGNSQYRRNDDMSNASFSRRDSHDRSFNDKFNPDRFDSNDNRRSDRDRGDQFRSNDSFDRDGSNRFNRDDRNDFGNDNFRRDGPLTRDFSGSGTNRGPNNDFRSGDFYGARERSNDRNNVDDRGGRNESRFNDQDQYGGPKKDSFNSNFDRDQSSNDRFRSESRFSSNDQFGNDRLGSDRSLSNDRFSSDRFGSGQNRMDSRDNLDRRDNFGNNNRNVGNNRFEQQKPEEMPAELKKLMEKRRAAMDVFKPSSSFLTPEKSTTNFGSLSESFRKITGDSPFLPKERLSEFSRDRGPRTGPTPDQSRSSGSFGGPDNTSQEELRDRGPPDFRSRGLGDFDTRLDTAGPRRSGDLGARGNNFGPRGQEQDIGRNRGFGNFNNRCDISPWENQPPLAGPPPLDAQSRSFGDFMNRSGQLSRGNQSPPQSQLPDKSSIATSDGEKNRESTVEPEKNIPPLEMPPWMDPQIMQNPLVDGDSANSSSTKESQPSSDVKTQEKSTADQNSNEPIAEPIKKPGELPFMGENDPKPEDMNMEPPPELPDLGTMKNTDHMQFDTRGPGVPPYRFGFFDEPFGSKGMPPKPKSFDSLGAREPENDRLQPPPLFGPREMNNPRGDAPPSLLPSRGDPHDGPFSSRNFNEPSFGQRAHNDPPFGQRGSNDPPFGQRGHNEPPFGQRGHNAPPFAQRGLNEPFFGQRGHNELPFGPRGLNELPFGQRGPNEPPFGQRGPNEPPFGQRGPNEPPFGQRGPNEPPFSQRGPNEPPFGQRGLINEPPFTQRDPNDGPFGPRDRFDGPFDREPSNLPPFGPREGPEDRFGPRGSNQGPEFGPRGPNRDNFPSGDGPFGPRGFDDRPPFRSQGPDEPFMPRGPNDLPFNQRLGDTGPRNNIPSLLSFKFDGPMNLNDTRDRIMPMDHPRDRPFDRPFRNDNNQPPFGPSPIEERSMQMRPSFPGNEFHIENNNLGPPFGPGSIPSQRDLDDRPVDMPGPRQPLFGPMNSISREPPGDIPPSISDALSDDRDPFSRRPKNHPGYRRTGPVRQQFCIEKQFNYNHGGGQPDEIFTEFIPSKVIEYGNIRRPTAENYATPMQCFDYGHGNIKPNVIDHDIYPRMEFKYWVEGEHNLKEYSEGMRTYEDRRRIMKMAARKPRREVVPVWRYEERRTFDEHRSPWERNEKSRKEPHRSTKEPKDYKSSRDIKDSGRGKRRRERSWDRDIEMHRERTPRSNSEDRTRDKVEKTQKDSNTECNKNDERSKGNESRQENPMNTSADPTTQEISNQDVTNVADEPPKTMELAKSSNITMVDDILCPPGRQTRPPKIAIILRGPPGSGKSFVAKLIKDKELEQGGSAPRILSLDDYFLTEKEVESTDDNGKKIVTKEMVYEHEEAMESSYIASLVKAFKKNIIDGYFNFIILDCINEKIADYEEMWSFAKTKGFRVYVCEMEMDVQICLRRNVHKRTEDEINKIVDYFEPTPSYHQILDVASLLQEQAIQEVHMEEAESTQGDSKSADGNDDSQDSQEDYMNSAGVSKWEKMEAEDKLDRLDGLAKRKNEGKPQTMEDFLQVPDYYNMEDTSGKKRVRWADLEERKEQEKMRAVGFVVGQTNWNRMMDPTKGGSALTRTKFFNLT